MSLSTSTSRTLVALVLASIFASGTALAQTRGAAPTPASGTQVNGKRDGNHTITYKDRTNYDFDDDQVEGTLVQPDTDLITGRLRATHDSLVRLRTTFQPEMLKSVESL